MTNLSTLASRVEDASTWRKVPNWSYEASDSGQLRNAVTKRILHPSVNQGGYEHVSFQTEGRRRSVRVHRAIYEAWHGPIPDGLTINHLNGDKRDNRPSNLEACTVLENVRHAAATGLMPTGKRNGAWTQPHTVKRGSQKKNTPLKEADIPVIREMADHGVKQTTIARKYGVSKYCIHLIVKGKTWRHAQPY